MMNSEHTTAAERLASLMESMQSVSDGGSIDERVSAASDNYRLCRSTYEDARDVFEEMVAFVTHLCRRGCLSPMAPLPCEAYALAVDFLDLCYPGLSKDGHDDAVLDVLKDDYNIYGVLDCIAEAAKRRFLQQRQQWIISSHLDGLTWNIRCEMVAVILADHQARNLGSLSSAPVSFLAGELEVLIDKHLDAVLGPTRFARPSPFARCNNVQHTATSFMNS
jgi:hypothetical protein